MAVGYGGGMRVAGRQHRVHPMDYQAEVSQRLVDAVHRGDRATVMECLADPIVDVNYSGAVRFKGSRAELVPRAESAAEVRFELEEFLTDVSPLFLAAHSGDLSLCRKLLSLGADVNQKLFRGNASTAAVREGNEEVVELLLRAGANQAACEEALVEASRHGKARMVDLIMGSDLVRPRVAVQSLVTAASRGFVDVIDILIKAGASADVKVRLGAWAWDGATGEELRVGAGLAEPYDVVWCAVEYFESCGEILGLLLGRRSPDSLHIGRSLLHHAILSGSSGAAAALLSGGADCELPVRTAHMNEFRPVHMAARLDRPEILQSLVDRGCDLNSRTDTGETSLMLSARFKSAGCVKVLAAAGADFGLISSAGASAAFLAAAGSWSHGFRDAVLDAVRAGAIPQSSNSSVFTLLTFVAKSGDVSALQALLEKPDQQLVNVDDQDEHGFSAAMVAAKEGHVDAFRLLVFAGAQLKLKNNSGDTAISLLRSSKKRELFEQVLLDYAIEKGVGEREFLHAIHCAARLGDLAAVRLLTSKGQDVNIPDGDGYTPLMLAAREGHGAMCELLIALGARCGARTPCGETALTLARANAGFKNRAEEVIMDELARELVLEGGKVKKHTKRGKGSPHVKTLRMVAGTGVLRWGRSRRRNVVCGEVEVGASLTFQRNRRKKKKGDAFERGLFRVVTRKGKEVHFVCEGGDEEAELWVRGIMLVTRMVFGEDGI